MRVVLVVGHTEKNPGACNAVCGVCEFGFNKQLVTQIDAMMDDRCDTRIVYRDKYRDLPEKINKLNPNFVVCFHNNAFDTRTSGTETLYYYKSKKSEEIATIFQTKIVNALRLKDRGIKGKSTEERGGYILRYTNAPCILLEPFFIDHDNDYRTAISKYPELLRACNEGICETLDTF